MQLRQILYAAVACAVSFTRFGKCEDSYGDYEYLFLAAKQDMIVNAEQYNDIGFDLAPLQFIDTHTQVDGELTSAYLNLAQQIMTVPWTDRIKSEASYLQTASLDGGNINTSDPDYSRYFYDAGPYSTSSSSSEGGADHLDVSYNYYAYFGIPGIIALLI
ncbi:unnamed protein product [[Candida] boidinii]|uniref:Unnamed protein product n=1 Tax=Candida boidinii TaxID=5477 RepID=A0A9W6SUE9_CANBO|nr:hypothetical protein BVG19_g1027 [[Candida] boidinii]OWB50636.1 hypothetical protein B5S27_g2188 [[Candida] boidinii]OWB66949.1 hypothetical protein B5S30_g2298 [[Candida] boidinii]OWB82759.1 hypothetical protein B5S33_g1387 [[Candida] boidinii]GME67015.1 unnamed protein product [[Candida] boidinii]